jgi:DNA invertase Pin-like site-specific DNA recombinase
MNPRSEIVLWKSEKIQASHLDRLAIVYVRQSTLRQVAEHQESTQLQYGLVHRAEALGWHPDRVLTIDDDLGKSGSSVEGRIGFQKLVAEVGLNHVGLILGIEMSRLARSSTDWHQLLEICALFDTLIADLDGLYDPSQYNDRLLLGLKGTMSEAELHILKQRMLQGRLHKAKKGELRFGLPIGYVQRPSTEICFDPDEQVQQVVRLIFRKYGELGTVHSLLRYLTTHQVQIGVRARFGLNKGELEWRHPKRSTLLSLLNHPIYAGAYAYGRKQVDPRRQKAGQPRSGVVTKPPEDWLVLIRDHHPAYISWEQYQNNLGQLKANQNHADERGSARQGRALLSGLVFCQKCRRRMSVQYHRPTVHNYICRHETTNQAGAVCQFLSGNCLDEFISEQVLKALEPAALELALSVATHMEQERRDLECLWRQRLERAAYEAERAGKHYQLVEPENRLVARHLAQVWEEKITIQQQVREDYQRFCCQQSRHLTETERDSIRQLAHDIPALWEAKTTTQAQRKEIIRQAIQAITVMVLDDSEFVEVNIDWIGGASSQARIIRPVARWSQLSNYPQLCERIIQLAESQVTTDEMITCLHQEGFYAPRQVKTFTRSTLRTLMRKLGCGTHRSPLNIPLSENEWLVPDLARKLDMPTATLYGWVKRDLVRARQLPKRPKYWVIWADADELERLRVNHQRSVSDILHERWSKEALAIYTNSETTTST